jgi:hypothetical protein
MIDQTIWKWDGTAWAALTRAAPTEVEPAFQFVSEKRVYAAIGNQMGKWEGGAWSTVTDVTPWNTQPAFHFVSESLIYALLSLPPYGNQIWKWDGRWSSLTPMTSSDTKAFQFESEESIFAMIGNQVWSWNGAAWTLLTDVAPGDTQASFQVVNDHLVYAVIGTQVYKWTPM